MFRTYQTIRRAPQQPSPRHWAINEDHNAQGSGARERSREAQRGVGGGCVKAAICVEVPPLFCRCQSRCGRSFVVEDGFGRALFTMVFLFPLKNTTRHLIPNPGWAICSPGLAMRCRGGSLPNDGAVCLTSPTLLVSRCVRAVRAVFQEA